MKDLIVGTAGHIDHGKTTLVRALTGIDADRLKEEKQRGITIDIGFAHMDIADYRVGFIDVPGHERFVKNMLAGIGGIHLLMLVVASDESVMPQTVEHFQICQLLSISRGIVVLTKIDQVDPELLPLVEDEIRDLARRSFLEEAPIVAVDSLSGRGIPELKQTLIGEIEKMDRLGQLSRPADRVFRLPIDRVFSVRGFGTVVTGTLQSGSISRGAQVAAYPGAKTGKIKGIEIFNAPAEAAEPGQRTAVNLSGLDKEDLCRGMTLSLPNALRTTGMVDTWIRLLPSAPQLSHRSPIRFHHGSGEHLGRIHLLDRESLKPGEEALSQIRLATPVLCFPEDPFILRRYSPVSTIGGGVILDNAPSKHRKRDRKRTLASLSQLREGLRSSGDARFKQLLEFLVDQAGESGTDLDELVSRTGFTPETLMQKLVGLDSALVVSEDPLRLVSVAHHQRLELDILEFLERFHSQKPLAPGVSKEEVKRRFFEKASVAHFQFVLRKMEDEKKIEVTGGHVALFGLETRLTESQTELERAILNELSETPFQPVSSSELAGRLGTAEKEVRDVYYYLLNQGRLVRIAEEFVLLREQLEALVRQIREAFPDGREFSVPELKTLFGITRKYAIPLLEYLDRQRITRRVGDVRKVI